MRLREYLYLDTAKLEDFSSALDPGTLNSLKETTRTETQTDGAKELPTFNEPAGAIARTAAESIQERSLSISVKHSFSRLYDAIQSDITSIDEYDALPADFSKNIVLEITRDFAPSPVNQMIDSLLQLTELMQSLGLSEHLGDAEAQQAFQMISLFLKQGDAEDSLPMISAGDVSDDPAEPSILFVAQRKFILCNIEDFEGTMTLVGRIQKVVPEGQAVDLLELLRLLPRQMRRSKAGGNEMRDAIVSLFEQWPNELGGAVPASALELKGPAYVMAPLAVYL